MTALWISLAVVGALAPALGCWVLIPHLALRRNRRLLQERATARRAIAITFDDGPGRELTPRVLDRLAEASVRATFFVLGRSVRQNPEALAAIQAGGHELGTHGNEHVHHLKTAPMAGRADTAAAWQALDTDHGLAAGSLPFRPPYGKLNLLSWLAVRRQRTPIAMWTHDGWDTRPDIDRGGAALAAELRTAGGGVVLLHDFDRANVAAADDVLARLDAVLELAGDGFEFVTVGELLLRA